MSTEQTAGTTAQDGGDAAVTQTAGTPGVADRNAESEAERLRKLEQEKQQWLAEKSNLERLKEENNALLRAVEAMNPPPTHGVDPLQQNLAAEYQRLQFEAANGNVNAQFQLAAIAAQQAQIQKLAKDTALNALGAERAGVEAVLNANPGMDVPTAARLYRGEQAQKELEDYRKREEEAKRIAEERARAGDVGVGSVRPAPASELKQGAMKASAFKAQMEAFNARIAQGDQSARAEALALRRKVDSGTISLILNE